MLSVALENAIVLDRFKTLQDLQKPVKLSVYRGKSLCIISTKGEGFFGTISHLARRIYNAVFYLFRVLRDDAETINRLTQEAQDTCYRLSGHIVQEVRPPEPQQAARITELKAQLTQLQAELTAVTTAQAQAQAAHDQLTQTIAQLQESSSTLEAEFQTNLAAAKARVDSLAAECKALEITIAECRKLEAKIPQLKTSSKKLSNAIEKKEKKLAALKAGIENLQTDARKAIVHSAPALEKAIDKIAVLKRQKDAAQIAFRVIFEELEKPIPDGNTIEEVTAGTLEFFEQLATPKKPPRPSAMTPQS